MQCLLKKENPDQEPSAEKIARVSGKLDTLSQTIENYEEIDTKIGLTGDVLTNFRKGIFKFYPQSLGRNRFLCSRLLKRSQEYPKSFVNCCI